MKELLNNIKYKRTSPHEIIVVEYIDTLSKMDKDGIMYNDNGDVCIHKDGDDIIIDYNRVFYPLYNKLSTITGNGLRNLIKNILSRYYKIDCLIVKNSNG